MLRLLAVTGEEVSVQTFKLARAFATLGAIFAIAYVPTVQTDDTHALNAAV